VVTPHDATRSIDSLDAVIAAYLQDVEVGQVPNRQELLDRHPELADALRVFFADLDRMDRVAAPLRLAAEADATGTLDGEGCVALTTIRYFGDYELLEEIARGGMGVVYKARQASLNRLVALKMVLAGTFASARDVQRFRAEAESAANLDHPHIVAIYEVGEHEGQQYYTMKFVEGTSLSQHPRGAARNEVAGLVDVARAVHHAHQHGVLHRDLKPSNVLVDLQGIRLVTDFGLAKRLAGSEVSLTEPGQVLGTPRYMAPEQAAGRKDLTVAADVYSLGVILYERLTGRTPFTGDDVLTLLRQVRESEPPRPSKILPGLDRDLETVVLKCLEKEPARRYASAADLADDLDRWRTGRPITARPSGSLSRAWKWARRNPVVAALSSMIVVLLIMMTVFSMLAAMRFAALARSATASGRSAAASARSSQGLYLAAQSELVRPSNPGLALILALDAVERHPGPIAREAVLAALEANDELRTLIGHKGKVTTVAVAPDGRTAVTGSDDQTARLWDIDSGRLLATLDHDAPLVAVRFTPDGRRLVTFSSAYAPDGGLMFAGEPKPQGAPTVNVWEVSTGRRLAEWSEAVAGRKVFQINPARAMDLSRDGQRLVVTSGGYPGQPPRIIDLDGGTVRAELSGHDGPVSSVAISPDGRRVATASVDRTARIWDAETGRELHRLNGHSCHVWFAAFSPDGRRLLTLGSGMSSTFTQTPHGFQASAPSGDYTPEKVAGRIWDVETGAELASLAWPGNPAKEGGYEQYGFARVARFQPDGSAILTAGRGFQSGWSGRGPFDVQHPAVWEAGRGGFRASLRRAERDADSDPRAATDIAFSPDGQRIAIGYADGIVRLLRGSGELVKTLSGHTGAIRALAFTPDGRRLVSASDDGTARAWDTRIGDESDFAHGRWPLVEALAFRPDCRMVAAVVNDYPLGRFLAFRDAATGRELARTKLPDFNEDQPPVFSGDGRTILVPPILYAAASGHQLRTFGTPKQGHPSGLWFALSPDGRTVALADGDGHLHEADTGRERLRLAGFEGQSIRTLLFSPDGTKVVSFSWGPRGGGRFSGDILACLWDARDGRRLAVLQDSGPELDAPVHRASFDVNGRRLATASSDRSTRVWDVATGQKQLVLRGHGGDLNSVAFAPDGRRILTASDDGTARVWDAASGREIARLEGHDGPVRRALFNADGEVILTSGNDRTARLWDGRDGRPICTLVRHDVGIRSAGFSPDGRTAFVSFHGQPALTRTWPVGFLAIARARRPRDLMPAERARFELPAP
jgi:WD40 repeat protein/predicted Ser/Thr protein kinase